MPSKSQRAASSQAKQRKNKKRGKIASRVYNSAPSPDISINPIEQSIDSATSNPSSSDQNVSRPGINTPQGSTLQNTSPVYPHLARELRLIFILAVGMFGILGVSYFIFIN